MKKTLISLSVLLFLVGCTSNQEKNSPDNFYKPNQKTSNFSNAFIGSFMEINNKSNNAIIFYEDAMGDEYNYFFINKLLYLYSEKKDYIGVMDTLNKIPEKEIKNYNSEFYLPYYLIKNNNKEALKIINQYSSKTDDNLYHLKRMNELNKVNEYLTLIPEEYKNDFYKATKKEDESLYLILNILENSSYNSLTNIDNLIEENKGKLNNNDLYILYFISYSLNPNINTLKEIDKIDDNYYILSNTILKHLKNTLKNQNYQETQKIVKLISGKTNNEAFESKLPFLEYLTYFYLFDNKNALFKLESLKDGIEKDMYFSNKALLNYRLGYKTASAKYFSEIKNIKWIKNSLEVYIDAKNDKDLELLKDNYTDIEILNLRMSYYIQKENYKKATEIKKEIEKNISKNKINNQEIDINFIIVDFFNNNEKGLDEAKKFYYRFNNIYTANLYAYLSSVSNKNIDASIDLLEHYITPDLMSYDVLDTYAMLLMNKGEYKDALDIYINKKMLYKQDYIIQKNISNAYFKLGDEVNGNKHLDYAKQLFNW